MISGYHHGTHTMWKDIHCKENDHDDDDDADDDV